MLCNYRNLLKSFPLDVSLLSLPDTPFSFFLLPLKSCLLSKHNSPGPWGPVF